MFSDLFLQNADPNDIRNVLLEQQRQIDELRQAVISAQRASGLVDDIGDLDISPDTLHLRTMLPAQTECWTDHAGALSPFNHSAFSAGGSCAAVASEENHPGIFKIISGGVANGGGYIEFNTNTSAVFLQGGEVFEAIVRLESFATQSKYRFGFYDLTQTGSEVDGVYFDCTGDGSAYITVTPSVYSNSVLNTGSGDGALSFLPSTWYKIVINIAPDLSQADFYIYIESSGGWDLRLRYTTIGGLPSGTGRETGVGVKTWRTSATATTLLYVDRIDYYNNTMIR